jgi:hypothetical protein
VIPVAEVALPDGDAPTAEITVIPMAVKRPPQRFRKQRKPVPPKVIRLFCRKEHTDCCSICLASIKGTHPITQCRHCFHQTCIETWFASNKGKTPQCPKCRGPVKKEKWAMIIS